MNGDEPVVDLTSDERWDLLGADGFGRLSHRLVDDVHLVPINDVVDDRSLLLRIDTLPRQSWIPTPTDDLVEVVPVAVTGLGFRLQRPEPDHQPVST